MYFNRPLADAKNYPTAIIKAYPKKVDVSHHTTRADCYPDEVKCLAVVNQARTALYVVAKSLTSDVVWLPSYHCPALVEPFIAANKHIKYYSIKENLEPDMDYLNIHANSGDIIVGIRYFGFDCGVKKLAKLSNNTNMYLIEDLAHAAFIDQLYGDVGITSLVKFYPTEQGAEILTNYSDGLDNTIVKSTSKLSDYRIVWLKNRFTFLTRKVGHKFKYFNKVMMSKNVTNDDRNIIDCSDHKQIISQRRKNYLYLCDELQSSTLGEVILSSLPENVVPFALPFRLHDLKTFDLLREQGIQIQRWEEIVVTKCEVSNLYRKTLIFIPCQQDLREVELNKIISVLIE